jgi:uncharacterized protein (TIGR03083 family)
VEHWEAIAAERLALADQLDGLTDDQWATPSLCGEWTVRHVVAHLVMPHRTSLPRFMVAMAVAGGSFDRANVALTGREALRPTADLVADLRRYADSRFKPPGLGSVAPLTDVLVHGQDIRVPLGLATDRPVEPWADVLEFLVSPRARRGFVGRRLPELRLVATDVDWSWGQGDEVRGPAIALALAVTGRRACADELVGPGTARLLSPATP